MITTSIINIMNYSYNAITTN